MTATIRPKDESAISSVAAGDIFLVDGTGGVRALAATSVAYTNAANTFVGTQTIGALVATTVNGNTIATGTGILILGAGKTLTASNTLALAGTDGTTMTFPATSATIARTDAANTFTGHQTIEGVTTTGATGTGNLVFATSPALTTPSLGVATATSINKVALTAPAIGSTLTIADGKTLTVSNGLTLAGTDGTTMTFPATSATIARTDAANTFTGTQTVGALVATTVNGNTITTGTGVLTLGALKTLTVSNSLTLAGTDGKTLTVSNSLALAGTDGTTQTFPSTSGTVVTSVSSNVVTNAMRSQMAAYTLKGNATNATANEADITIDGLTLKASPAAGDEVMIWDVAGSALKKTTASALSTVGSVASINGLTGALTGILTGTRLAKTAAYTVANADVGSTLALGGSAFYAATFGPASGYTAPWAIRVFNEDTTRGKLLLTTTDVSTTSLVIGTGSKAFTITAGLDIAVGARYTAWSASGNTNWMSGPVASYSGTTLTITVDTIGGTGTKTDWQIGAENILWPRQDVIIENQNNVWKIYGLRSWMPDSQPTLNADPTNGSDRNDGLGTTTGALKTLAAAAALAYRNIYMRNVGSITIDGGSNTFQELVSVFYPLNGGGTLIFQNLTWRPISSGYCLEYGDGALVGLTNVTFNTTGVTTPGGYIVSHNHGILDVNAGVSFTTGGIAGSIFDHDSGGGGGSQVNINNGLTITNAIAAVSGFLYKAQQPNMRFNINGTHTYVGTPNFGRYCWASQGSNITFQGNVVHSGAISSGVGLINQNGVVQNLAGTLPGGVITPTTGGQYNTTTTA